MLVGLEGGDAGGVIRALSERLAEKGVVDDAGSLERRLLEREAAYTCLGHGVAVPHATVPGLLREVIVLGQASEDVTYDDPTIDPVRLFFLVLSPPDRASTHIKLLARIARLARHREAIERLERADSAAALLREVEHLDEQHV